MARTPVGVLTAATLAAALTLSACSSAAPEPTSPEQVDTAAAVTISVGGKPTAEKPKDLAAFERRLAEFGEKYPNITVEAEETQWEADTFQALLAGGQLPTTISVPFTEMQGLIARGQVADVTEFVQGNQTLAGINPTVMPVASNADGRLFGVPTGAYTMGLLYNRALFTQAGLDPDQPPTTWDEVRTAAKAIEDKTDAQGFQSMTLDNTGGWILTTMSYAFGSTMQSEDGTTATVNNPATAKVLDFYKTLRFGDNSFGSNFLINYEDAGNAFAGGRVGMFVQGADAYGSMVVTKGMAKEDFGLTSLPQAEGGLGTLGGGSVQIVNPTSTPEQINAAMKWIEHMSFERYTDEAVAKADAEAAAADGLAVGAPGLPILNQEADARYLQWIAEYVNVPRENYAGYLDTVETVPLLPEPPVKAQELYASLDPVVQAVLTRQDADVDQLLGQAQTTVQSAMDAG